MSKFCLGLASDALSKVYLELASDAMSEGCLWLAIAVFMKCVWD